MKDDAMILAVGRLERAIARVERAAASASPAPRPHSLPDAELQERHDRLKAETRHALAAMDRLISGEVR